MARIVGIGIATLDIINTTDGFPEEDAEVRALSQRIHRGGNVTNTLTVLSQLGHQCEWAGTLGDDTNSEIIEAELLHHNIDCHRCKRVPDGHAPTSYITLNQQNGSRTIVHYRDLPEYHFADFCTQHLEAVDWLHFEARHVPETIKMLRHARDHYPTLQISIEIEKPRERIEELYPFGDVVFFSRHFAAAMGYNTADAFLSGWRPKCGAPVIVCTWGAQGASALDRLNNLYHADAVQIARVVDTIGAGDTFNAGYIHASLTGKLIPECLQYANALAGKKCGQMGFNGLGFIDDALLDASANDVSTNKADNTKGIA
jgi:ketohexokinase